MRESVKRVWAPIFWGVLGVLLLVAVLRAADVQVLAGSAQDEVQASFTTTQVPVCRGSSIYFIDTSTAPSGIAGVEWDFGDGTTSTESPVEYVYARAGIYTVWLTATSVAGSQDATSMEVGVEEVVAAIDPAGPIEVCQYAPVTFENASQVTGTVRALQWHFSDDDSTSTASSVLHTFDSVGSYDVTLAVTTSAGCSDTATTSVNVLESPVPQIAVSDDTVDVGATVYFTDTGSGGSTWQWDFGDGTGTPPQTTPYASHAYSSGGRKTVVLTATATSGCANVVDGQVGVLEDIYLPMVGNHQVEIYADDFSDSGSGWPTWDKDSSGEDHRGGYLIDVDRAQLLAELIGDEPEAIGALDLELLAAEPEVFFSVVHDAWDRVFVGGPHKTMTGNFVYEFMARYTWTDNKNFAGNEYGLLISKEQVHPADARTVHGYVFSVEINPKLDGSGYNTAGWVLERWSRKNWDGEEPGGSDHKSIKGPHTSSAIKSAKGSWNHFRIERDGSHIRVFVNGTLLAETDDGTYTGPMHVGFYAEHTGSGATELSYDVMFEWDDVYVESE